MKIEINDELIKKISKRIEQNEEFASTEEYVNYILKQVIENMNEESEDGSEEENERVKKELRKMGYLD